MPAFGIYYARHSYGLTLHSLKSSSPQETFTTSMLHIPMFFRYLVSHWFYFGSGAYMSFPLSSVSVSNLSSTTAPSAPELNVSGPDFGVLATTGIRQDHDTWLWQVEGRLLLGAADLTEGDAKSQMIESQLLVSVGLVWR